MTILKNPLFNLKNDRTKTISKNVILSLLLKGISIGTTFLLVPLTLHSLDQEQYGVWLTLSSIIGWFSLFDIGLGNGFRNKFAEALALKDTNLAKIYVSTTFFLLTLIIIPLLFIFIVANNFLNWGIILNTSAVSQQGLSMLALINFVFFSLRFIFGLILPLLMADQKSALADLLNVLGNLLSLIIIYILLQIRKTSLLLLGFTLSAVPVFVLFVACFFIFYGKYSCYKPSLGHIKLKYSKDLIGLGIMFFIPAICSLIVFSTSNIIIAQIFTPMEVTKYNIAFKYYSLAITVFQIVINPFWSAFTDAFIKDDTGWIKSMLGKLKIIWVMSCIVAAGMVLVSNIAFKLWVGDQIKIPTSLSIGLAIYICINNWNSIFVAFNAGVSKVLMQVLLSSAAGIIFIPLAILLSKKCGLIGIPLAMGLSILHGAILSPIQCNKIINGKARGIWNE
jgi:O-antigen/teichoic acid export membrane protein